MNITSAIKRHATALGFDLVGITDASPVSAEDADHYLEWLDAGFEGQMSYLHNHFEKRINPARLMEGARSVIVVGLNYKVPQPPSLDARDDACGRVVSYAQYEDYHPFIKSRLGRLAEFVAKEVGGGFKFKICVDSAPLLERAIARRAGLGFIGRNHMLINPLVGVQILLGELITNVELQADMPAEGSCGDCRLCVDACPTGALAADGRFDASRCLSYLTIEHEGPIGESVAKKHGDRLFGCEECLKACPYHKRAGVCSNPQFRRQGSRAVVKLNELLKMSERDFCGLFGGSPVQRAGLARLQRNARLCLKNAKQA